MKLKSIEVVCLKNIVIKQITELLLIILYMPFIPESVGKGAYDST